ncbi:hypothetical protein RJZ57_006774 [Blastomyces gilchristii]
MLSLIPTVGNCARAPTRRCFLTGSHFQPPARVWAPLVVTVPGQPKDQPGIGPKDAAWSGAKNSLVLDVNHVILLPTANPQPIPSHDLPLVGSVGLSNVTVSYAGHTQPGYNVTALEAESSSAAATIISCLRRLPESWTTAAAALVAL